MALFDVLFEFSDAQSVSADTQSTDVLDWGSGMEDLEMGAGTPIWLNVKVAAAASAGTSLNVEVYTHTAATSINSGTLLFETGAIAQASLTAGAWIIRCPLPVHCDDNRYLGLYYDATGTLTGCTVDAWLDHGPQSSHNTQVTASNI